MNDDRQFHCQYCVILVPKEREVVLGCVTYCSAACVRMGALKEIEDQTRHHQRRVADCLERFHRFNDLDWLARMGFTW